VTNAINNAVVWEWSGEPFGTNAPNEDLGHTGKFTLNLRYAGQYYDQESNLFHNGFRDYNPQIGRYVQSDPIGLAGGINTYNYVGGNPISRVDPFGLLDTIVYEGGRLKGYDDLATEFDVAAVSGPWGNGRLPNGTYNASNLRHRNNAAMSCPNGDGWSIDLDPTFPTNRTDLRIHPDGNVPGTEGCIGPSCGADQKKVYDSLKNYFSQPGHTFIPVIVR
jgi:RHS repeat-associated protein